MITPSTLKNQGRKIKDDEDDVGITNNKISDRKIAVRVCFHTWYEECVPVSVRNDFSYAFYVIKFGDHRHALIKMPKRFF